MSMLVQPDLKRPSAGAAPRRSRSCVPAVITIDTEPDDAWGDHQNPSVGNVQALRRLQTLLDGYGAPVTLLVTYRVAGDDNACAVISDLVRNSRAEVGAHLHPWETPPFLDSRIDSDFATFPHELPLDAFEAKLRALTDLLTSRFGVPRVYRAGRWGLTAPHLPVLERLGYRVDTSVIPLMDWRGTPGLPQAQGGIGGVDFRAAPRRPYHPSYRNVSTRGDAEILEVPVTVAYTRAVPRSVRDAYTSLPYLARRLLSRARVLDAIHATPAEETTERLTRMIAAACAERPLIFNLTVHSSELALGTSPQTRTPELLEGVFSRIRHMLDALRREADVQFMTLSDAADAWRAAGAADESGTRMFEMPMRVAGSEPIAAARGAQQTRRAARNDHGARPRSKIGYILAASHSGSTLTAMLLGAHADVATAGELKATNLGDPEKYHCSCGTPIRQCAFWRAVAEAMRARGLEFDVTQAGTDYKSVSSAFARRLLAPLHSGTALERVRDMALAWSSRWRHEYPAIQARNAALVQSVLEASGKQIVIDSSKIAIRLKYLLRNPDLDVYVIRTIRDGRGVALTYMDPYNFADANDPARRGGGSGLNYQKERMSAERAAYLWKRSNQEADAAIAQLPANRLIQIRYEQLCADPSGTLSRVFEFLGVDAARGRLDFRAVPQHVVGNGMRLDSTSEIRLDERWRQALTPAELATFERVAGDLNRRYGYR